MYLDPNNSSTWQNYPAPYLDPRLQDEVAGIAGRRDCGCPMMRLVWGQTRMAWRKGKMRLLYVDERKANDGTQMVTRHTRHVMKRVTRYEIKTVMVFNKDFGCMLPEQGELPIFEERVISCPDDADRIEFSAPGWIYAQEQSLEWYGVTNWVIEVFKPERFIKDTPENWEMNRFGSWEDPELGHVAIGDRIGPYPINGRYESVGFWGEWKHEFDENGNKFLRYAPVTQESVNLIREAHHERLHREAKSNEQIDLDKRSEFEQNEAKTRATNLGNLEHFFTDDIRIRNRMKSNRQEIRKVEDQLNNEGAIPTFAVTDRRRVEA